MACPWRRFGFGARRAIDALSGSNLLGSLHNCTNCTKQMRAVKIATFISTVLEMRPIQASRMFCKYPEQAEFGVTKSIASNGHDMHAICDQSRMAIPFNLALGCAVLARCSEVQRNLEKPRSSHKGWGYWLSISGGCFRSLAGMIEQSICIYVSIGYQNSIRTEGKQCDPIARISIDS